MHSERSKDEQGTMVVNARVPDKDMLLLSEVFMDALRPA